MSSNEEYLDNLLKSMGDEDVDLSDIGEDFSADIDAMFAALEKSGELSNLDEENSETFSPEQPVEESTDVTDMSEMSELLKMPEEVQAEKFEIEETPAVDESEPMMDEVPTVESEPMMDEAPTVESEPIMDEAPTVESESIMDEAPSVEGTQDMSQEEIESMMAFFRDMDEPGADTPDFLSKEEGAMKDTFMENAFTENVSEESPAMDKEEEDILALLDSIQDDEDVSEINELLTKAENNEAVDESIFTGKEEAADAAAEIAALLGDEGGEEAPPDEEENKRKKKEKVKKEKVKKEKADKEQDGENKGPKEPGFFSKLFSKLAEEEAEPISEENQNIMKELEAEDAAEAGQKKPIKKGLIPGKKDDGEGEGTGKKAKKEKKKEKPKKEPKPKKEKPKKEPAAPEKPGKRISKASILVIVLFAATIFGVICFAASFLSGMLQKQRAKEAFAKQDYLSCYQELYGLDLTEEEEKMFYHARTVLKTERMLIKYENYLEDYQILEALDILMQALADYDELYAEAQSYGAETEVNSYYTRIYEILNRDYGLSRETAHAIADCESKVDYTRYLTALAAGEQISISGSGEGLPLPERELQDVLPAEEELLPPVFID